MALQGQTSILTDRQNLSRITKLELKLPFLFDGFGRDVQ